MREEPKIRIETREELICLLAEASAIEHNLMCCYLYAAWSLKRGERDGLTPAQSEAVGRWGRAITSVAIEEMTHLVLASNLLASIGAGPHLSRPDFPIPPGYHPSGVVVELAGFSLGVLDHFIFLERPEGKDLHDSSEFVPVADYHRTLPKGRLMPSAQDYTTVGHLYRGIRHGFEVLARQLGEGALFCGDQASQLGPSDALLPGVTLVRDLKSAKDAIETIIEQGEGAPGHSEDSHYNRFVTVRREYGEFLALDPAFAPAFPVAHNPVMRQPLDSRNRVHITAREAAGVLDLANSLYGLMLRCMEQAYGRGRDDEEAKRIFAGIGLELMRQMVPIGRHLASLPAGHSHPGVHAGVTFTTLRDMERLPPGAGERQVLAERTAEIARHAGHLFPPGHELAGLTTALEAIAGRFAVKDRGAANSAPTTQPVHVADDLPLNTGNCEVVSGRDIDIIYDGTRCIHSRFCVLNAPAVFRANTPGDWIQPDAMETEALVRVAESCPSGAIRYRRKSGPPEAPPPVNVVHLRENGPYAFHAPLSVDGADIGMRATLCRCGASKNKPLCDGSHNAIGFKASGEPDIRNSQSLALRDGALQIAPQTDGPLQIIGNLEICSGTGRTIDRVTGARLCRCGGSRSKPFCDGTHANIGFKSG